MRSQTVVSGGSSPVSSGPLASSAAACGGSGTGSADRFVDAAERRAAVEGEHPVGRRLPAHRGIAERVLGVPDAQRVLVEAEHRVGAGGLGRDREVAPLLRLAQPRHGRRAGRREAERRLGPRPRQRHPGPVAAGVVAVRAVEDRVLAELVGDVLHLPQPEFLALVDVDGAGQRHRQQRRRPRPAGAELQVGPEAVEVPSPLQVERGVRPAVPGDDPVDVVVGQHPGRRGLARQAQRLVDHLVQRGGVPRAAQVREVEDRVQLARVDIAREPRRVGQPDLADQDPARVLVGDGPPGPVDLVHLVQVGVRVRVARVG